MTSKREDREALITEAAEAILEAMGGIVPDELESMHADAAKAALAVFEQAHTPTDDERDELEVQDLATVIGNVVIDYEDTGPHSQRPITIRDTCADWPMEIAGEVQAAGFRRPVQGEPTDAQEAVARLESEHLLRLDRLGGEWNQVARDVRDTIAALRATEEATR